MYDIWVAAGTAALLILLGVMALGLLRATRRLKAEVEARAEAESNISRIARQWTATLDGIPDLVSVHDRDFRLIRVNRALADRFEREPAELIGMHCYRLFHEADGPLPECPHRRAMESRSTVTAEQRDPVSGAPLLVTCSPFLDANGDLVGTVHLVRDISHLKLADDEKQALIARQEHTLANVKLLSGFLPICSYCKKIRDDQGAWIQIETYIRDHSEASFTHGICPACRQENFPGLPPRRAHDDPTCAGPTGARALSASHRDRAG